MRPAFTNAVKNAVFNVQRARFHAFTAPTTSPPTMHIPMLKQQLQTAPQISFQLFNTQQLFQPNFNQYSHLCKPSPAQLRFYAQQQTQQPALITQQKLNFNLGIIAEQEEGVQFTSVLRKRRTKMNRHKLKKRRKRERFLTRKSTKE